MRRKLFPLLFSFSLSLVSSSLSGASPVALMFIQSEDPCQTCKGSISILCLRSSLSSGACCDARKVAQNCGGTNSPRISLQQWLVYQYPSSLMLSVGQCWGFFRTGSQSFCRVSKLQLPRVIAGLITHHLLATFHFLSLFLTPSFVFQCFFTFEVNYLQLNSYLRVCFWRNPN